MSNIALVYPNRAIEVQRTGVVPTGLYGTDWANNTNLPLSNILTDCLPETARTAQTRCSFAVALKSIPYRIIGAAALLNHNLTTSARIKHTIFNEPPIAYCNTVMPARVVGTLPYITITGLSTSLVGKSIVLFACSNDPQIASLPNMKATVLSHNLSTGSIQIRITESSVTTAQTINFSQWYVGDLTTKAIKVVNTPKWQNVWQRIFDVDSPFLVWESTNFWTGTIEEEQRQGYTKLCLNFFESVDDAALQPSGTHIHIDINDSSNTDGYIDIGYFMFGQYFQSAINPQYGSIEHGYLDNSTSRQSDSGQKYFHEKSKARTVSIGYEMLDKAEAFSGIFEAYRQQGISRPVIYSFSPIRTDNHQYAQSFIGRFTQLNPITQPNYGFFSATINLEEML